MNFGLDAKKAAEICHIEMFGDWYRDPWGWPELNWIKSNPQDFPWKEIIHREGSITLRREPRFEPTVVPKSRLGVRPAVIMSLDARIAYAASVAQVMTKLHANLPDWVYGWRLRDGPKLENNGVEWRKYSSFFHNPDTMKGYALQTDITSFFASIDVNKAVDSVYADAGNCAGAQLIEKIIRSHDELASRNGLPQRSWPSAILANRYMAPLDDLMTQRISGRQLSGVVRWMDDIYVTGAQATLYKFFIDFQSRVRELGLEINSSKSNLGLLEKLRTDVILESLKEVPLPVRKKIEVLDNGSDAAETPADELDIGALKELEALALKAPTMQAPATIKLILKTLRKHNEFTGFSQWLECAHELPHLADKLSRYFRDAIKGDSRRTVPYCEWYHEHRSTDWAATNWSSAQFSLAVSSATRNTLYKEILIDWLENGRDIHQISVAAQRLSVLDPSATKDIIRRRIDDEARPIFQRVYALALINAKDERSLVAKAIKQDISNIITRRWLEETRYAPPSPDADYDFSASRG
jgi:hypothetical protein